MKRLLFLLLSVPVFTNAQIITTFAGNGTGGYNSDGIPATASELLSPYGVGMDSLGNVYIGDAGNNRIRRVSPSGIITTIAGIGTASFSGDGGPATAAELNFPYGMAVNHGGSIVIADMNNHRIRRIKSDFLGGVIVTIAGNGTAGFSGDGGPATAAELNTPQGIFWDASNNVYFGDHFNHRLRKIDASGVITTIAGNGTAGFSGDGGPATAAELYYPSGVTMDAAGNIYIADMYNNCIRKVNTSGIISTVAGNTIAGYSGDGGAATLASLRYPKDVFVNSLGEIIISDPDNQRLRKVDLSGIITTIAGTGVVGYNGDGIPATTANLNEPQGVYVDDNDDIYTGDCTNNRIRKITCVAPTISPISGPGTDTVCIGRAVTMSDNTSGGVWSSSNSNTTVSPIGMVTGAATGLDTIVYSVVNSCTSAAVIFPVYVKSCGSLEVNPVAGMQKLNIYPNPADKVLYITGNVITSVAISNFLGQTVYSSEYNTSQVQVDIAALPKGIYFVKINDSEVRKFVKE